MTEWLSRPLYVSINQRLVNKNSSKNKGNFNHFWPTTLTPTEFADQIKSGYAYSYVFRGNTRSKKTFIEANAVSVDVDYGMTLDEAFKHELVSEYATIVYTTYNHTTEAHRFRIVFALEQPIRSLEEIEALASALATRLSGDPAVTTGASLSYGNTDADMWLFNNGLSAEFAGQLIAEAIRENESASGEPTLASTATGSSPGVLDLNLIIETADGRKLPAKEVREKTSVLCPFHDDENPSAIFNITRKGRRNIYCFVCKKTFAERGYQQTYDFDSFENAVVSRNDVKQPQIPAWVPGPAKLAFMNAQIEVMKGEHVGGIKPGAGLTFVKSPKSSGKTTALERLVEIDPGARVLLIGHRRSLIRAMCRKLRLDCYLDIPSKGDNKRQSRFGVCLDSLGAIDLRKPYDYVLIDESEQVLAHFFSDTMVDKRPAILRQLISIIGRASNVLALDADLSWLSYGFLTDWFNRREARPVSILLNQYVSATRSAELFQSLNHLVGDLVENLRDNRRCYVVSNNKAFVDNLSSGIALNDPDVKLVSITADTAQLKGDPAPAFISDPVVQSRRYQLVLSSPALSSGMDIRFENKERYFDVVYGFFQSAITSHLDCDQQLARVRDPGCIKLFLTPETQNLETDVDIMADELRRSQIFSYLIEDYQDDGIPRFKPDDDLLKLALPVHALQRASKNRLRENYLAYKRRASWAFDFVDTDDTLAELGSSYLSGGKKEAHDRYVERIMNAPKLTDYEIKTLLRKKQASEKLSLSEADSMRRACIERFYRRDAFPGLIELDRSTRLREKVRMFERVLDAKLIEVDHSMLQERLASGGESSLISPRDDMKVFLLRQALSRTPIFDGRDFVAGEWFHRSDLRHFREFIVANNAVFEAQFGRTFGKVVADNETKVLSDLLKYMYLPLRRKRRTGPNGTRPVYYKLDDVKLSGLMKLSQIRDRDRPEYGDEVDLNR